MTLPADMTRCLGRRSWRGDTDICPRRSTCERWTALQASEHPQPLPFALWLCEDESFARQIPMETEPAT